MLVPKAANESVKHAFMHALGIPAKIHPSYAFKTCTKHDAAASPYWVFSIVRNPFDRLVSCWMHKTQGKELFRPYREAGLQLGIPFAEFVEWATCCGDPAEQHIRPQAQELTICGRLIPDFVGRFESLDRAWARIRKKCRGLPDLPHKNQTEHRHYREYYTPETRRLVERRYAQDLELFGYEF